MRFFTILISALAFSHLLQMPVRINLSGEAWLMTQQLFTLYGSVWGFY